VAAQRSKREEEDPQPGVAPAGQPDADPPASASAEGAAGDPIEKLAAEKQDLTNTLIRLQADFDNYRKRIEKERGSERHRGVELLVENLLPVLDGFDRALAGHADPGYEEYRKGFELIRRQLWDVLSKQGLQRIDSVGKDFDPNVHHAIEEVVSEEHPEGTVVGEMQPGYTFHNRVLRPPMVRVASGRKN
jgi:molecular chaperone GrpE